mmetsp:Transcript_8029/g.18336  ORF Transcript_8029/g.18336 Transcript_8029/m.18336 type:complete len:107 (-) Transcript_8029:801-1121(-)
MFWNSLGPREGQDLPESRAREVCLVKWVRLDHRGRRGGTATMVCLAKMDLRVCLVLLVLKVVRAKQGKTGSTGLQVWKETWESKEILVPPVLRVCLAPLASRARQE